MTQPKKIAKELECISAAPKYFINPLATPVRSLLSLEKKRAENNIPQPKPKHNTGFDFQLVAPASGP